MKIVGGADPPAARDRPPLYGIEVLWFMKIVVAPGVGFFE